MSVRFTQSCPTCGRRIQVRASLLGCTVACQHCQAEFVADMGTKREAAPSITRIDAEPDPLMERVEQALQRSSEQAAAS